MSLSLREYLEIKQFEQRLPVKDFYEEDRRCVLRYAMALATCGMPGDAALEKSVLEELIVEYAYRRAYCNWITSGCGQPCDYLGWRINAKSIEEFNANE